MTSHATEMAPITSTVGQGVKTAETYNPTEDEIARVARQLWLDSGCPMGLDQEHWFRAEAILRSELAAKCEALSRRASIPHQDTRTEFEIVAEFTSGQWDGHWEVWEREWNCARWVWDVQLR